MFELLNNLIGLDLSIYYVPDSVMYVCCVIVVIFVIGEIFNITRVIFNFLFGKK